MKPVLPLVTLVALACFSLVVTAQPCLTGADSDGNCNGAVDINELWGYIGEWYRCSSCVPDIFDAIQAFYGIQFCGDNSCDSGAGEDCSSCQQDCGNCIPQPEEDIFFDDYLSLDYINQVSMNNVEWDGASEISLVQGMTPPALAQGLVGLWHLNELSGSAIDASGSGNDGTVYNVVYGAGGQFGTAYGFDGNGDYVLIPNSGTFDFTNGFTMSAWVYIDDYGSPPDQYEAIVSKSIVPMITIQPNGRMRCYLQTETKSGNWCGSSGNTVISNKTWTFITITYNSAGYHYYFNGNPDGGGTEYNGLLVPTSNPFYIGSSSPGYREWSGIIDEVAIWDRGLTQTEIQDLYSNNPLETYFVGASGSFESSPIDTNGQFNKINLTLSGANLGNIGVEISTDGSTWCPIANGGELDSISACLPGQDFNYRVAFNGNASLDSIKFGWGFETECNSGQTQLCSNQQGVCAGSFETCTAQGTWPGCDDSTYLAHNPTSYEPLMEVTCNDGLDNDCDSLTDSSDSTCTIYTITATAGTGGTITPSGDVLVNAGGDITFNIVPNSGYVVADMLVNGPNGEVSVGAESVYNLHRIVGDMTIDVRFIAQADSIHETIYVDGQLANDCLSGNYDAASRTCTGTDGKAYTSITEASNVAGQGDTVLIRAGTYNKQSGSERDVLWPKNSGTPQNPIIFRSYPGERAIIGGYGSFPSDTYFSISRGAITLKNLHDIIIEDLTVDHVAGWIYARGCTNITIRNNNFSRAGWDSKGTARFIDSNYNRIINNTFYKASGEGVQSGGDALQIVASNYNIIENNTFDSASHSLLAIRCGNFNVIRNNYLTNPWTNPSGGAAEKLVEIYDCRLDRNPNYSPSYIYPTQYDNTKYNLFEGNWFGYDVDYPPSANKGSRCSAIQFSAQNTIIRNNIFSNPLNAYDPRYPMGVSGGVGINMRWGGTAWYWDTRHEGVFGEGHESGYVYGNRMYNNVFNGYDGSKIIVSSDDAMSGAPSNYPPMEDVQDFNNYLFSRPFSFGDNIFKNNIFYEGNFTVRRNWAQCYDVEGQPVQVFMRGNVDSNIPNFERNDFFATGTYNDQSIPNVQDRLLYNNVYASPIAVTPSVFEGLVPGKFKSNLQTDPEFTDPVNENFNLQSSSSMIDAGAFLTKTVGTGSGTLMKVEDAGYFYDGYGIPGEQGDLIRLENGGTARILNIDYATNTLTLATSLSWTDGQNVSLAYSGSAPDIGAYECG